ncbi:hypothetical protein AY601_1970 [Pedobacter cryoconitis]|uniref:Thiopeptide-type bacteriocin biosynthesis protein n=1 Tax=Pedobacter cryoconitis TaxID=188932 RepID=A0A127VC06_9SPHI|nr:lantibiotic dehydratase [Pedobacter cryoconitis]AMP98876.1 hypothetical protein AY601_1970 [Pedobacter cryoconitis]
MIDITKTHTFDQRLVLRTPIYSLADFDKSFVVEKLICDPVFLEAIYIASPSLYNACLKYRSGLILVEKEILKFRHSLYKYYSRMHNRCTPFGLFSSCRLTKWREGESEVIIDNNNLRRHTRLDMHYLCALAAYLSALAGVRDQLLYFPNSSWYVMGEDIRYVEYKYVDGKRQHQISAVKSSIYLMELIEAARDGLTRINLIAVLEKAGIQTDSAVKFIDNCLDSQLLIPELDPAVTGDGLLTQLLRTLEKYNIKDLQINSIVLKLKQIEQLLNKLDLQLVSNITDYQEILNIIDTLDVPYEAGKIFQTDVTGIVNLESGLSTDLQTEILTALGILHKMRSNKQTHLVSFTKRFYERYGDRVMPLLEVLDTETGIGYVPDKHLVPSPILEGLYLSETDEIQLHAWGKWEQTLQKKWLKAYKFDQRHIEISEEDMEDIIPANPVFPFSVQLMFEVTSSGQIYVKHAGGTSPVNMIARFAQSDPELTKLASELTIAEQNNAPGVLFAEIVHLPEGRVGNVLQRPAFRNYEIPYLAKSLLPENQQIRVQDLFISYKKGKIVLYSKNLNKIIIPRLSNAHNFGINGLPVYHFLCDLQDQDQITDLKFNWGSLRQQYRFLPQVVFKNVILQRASWVFLEQDIQKLLQKSITLFRELLLNFIQEYNLPQKVFLADGDNELLINFEAYEETHHIFELHLKGRSQFVFKELLEPARLVKNLNEEHYMHEFQAFITMKPELNMKLAAQKDDLSMQEEMTATSCTDTEWLYYKLYCGVRNADVLLANPIKALVEHCEKKGWIKEWFFIRYTDSDFHIRLRLKLNDIKWLPYITRVFHNTFKPYRKTGFLWKIMTDDYQPEQGRYGFNTLALAEKFFYYDSISFLGFLDQSSGDERENLRWQYAILSIDTLLEAFEFTIEHKLEFIRNLKEAFASEFKFGAEQRKQLAKSFREKKSEIYASLSVQQPDDQFYEFYLILRRRTEQIDPIILQLREMEMNGTLKVSIVDLLISYVHMLVNRIIPEFSRLHEAVIYDFLYQYYKSVQGMKNRAQA